jgi:transposase
MSAPALPLAIGSVGDFASADKLAAYFGIVPRVLQSNDTEIQGRITKRGNALMCTTLVQCTLIALPYSPNLKSCYARIRERRGHGKAIIANARKLPTIIYNTLKKRMGVQRLRHL